MRIPLRFSLRRLLEITRDGTEDELAPEERAEFDRFIRVARIRPRNASLLELPKTTAQSEPPELLPIGSIPPRTPIPDDRRWRRLAMFSGLAASIAIATTVLAIGRARDAEREAELARNAARAVDRETVVTPKTPEQRTAEDSLRLTASKVNTPVGWKDTLKHHYDAVFSPEENLANLEKLSVAVRKEAARMRLEKPNTTAKEILDAIFETWGGPEH